MATRPQRARFGPCRAVWTGSELTIANRHVARTWRVENGLLWPTSLRDLAARRQWYAKPAPMPAPTPPADPGDGPWTVAFSARTGRENPVSEQALIVELTAAGASATMTYRFLLFPDARGVMMQLLVEGAALPAPSAAEASDEALDEIAAPALRNDVGFPTTDVLEYIEPDARHLRVRQVVLHDQTDHYNEVVQENAWLLSPNQQRLALKGNVFALEDPLTGEGLVLLKHAPLPHARPADCECDVLCSGGAATFWGARDVPYGPDHPAWPLAYPVAFYGHGMDDRVGEGYAWTLLAYTGGRAGQVAALQTFQRQLRPIEPGRDGLFLSNHWGDRGGPEVVDEAFVEAEIEAGARLGVDVVQLDHGWEQGTLSALIANDGAWQGFWSADPNFWEVETRRLPGGLGPLVDRARRRGLAFGLWFAPDSSDDFANWRRDAELVLRHHRQLDVNYFKIDGIKVRTRTGEVNLRRFFDHVLAESNGRVVFDFDVTAERRPGYFGLCHVGPLFVENRYTDWHRYWPHQTLRNLWKLAHFVDPVRLRMELLNHTRNTALYADDPLAPAQFSPAYLFAVTMFTSPLGWFEVSKLPESYFDQVAPLVTVWKAHRDRIFGGPIVPIGQAPDGTSWTGFVSVGPKGREGYLLIFRELNDRAKCTFPVEMLARGRFEVEPLAGAGRATIAARQLKVEIPEAKSFLLARFVKK